MAARKTALDRALQLTESGQCSSVSEIKAALKREGYWDHQLCEASLTSKLMALMKELKKPSPERSPPGG